MNYAIVLAGGSGTRAGGLLPKQFQMLGDVPVVWHSIRQFHKFDPEPEIMVVVHPDYYEFWNREIAPLARKEFVDVHLVRGGMSRIESVKNALDEIEFKVNTFGYPEQYVTVMIHDGARPFLTQEMIREGLSLVDEGRGAVPVIPVSDSLRMKTARGSKPVDRSLYMAVQTPQIFRLNDILGAYYQIEDEEGLTDDASVAERNGVIIATYPGAPENIKITNPIDFVIAEQILKGR